MDRNHWIPLKLTKNSSSFIFMIILAIWVLLIIPPLVFRSGFTAKLHPPNLPFQEIMERPSTLGKDIWSTTTTTTTTIIWRRMLSGPGSSPPRCAWKCGRCTPCKPIHVPVPPGTSVTAEYYPEAWRCKCGTKLYMP